METRELPGGVLMMMILSMGGQSDMNKSIYCLLAVLVTAAACNRGDLGNPEEEEVPASNATTVTVYAGGAGTRTSIRQEDGKYVVGWKKGDKLAVLEGVPAIASMIENDPDYQGDYAGLLYTSAELAADTDNAEFTLELKDRENVSGELQYVAIYPASAAIDVNEAWDYEKNRLIATIDFPRFQQPTADSFDPEADVLVSKVETCQNTRPQKLSFEFARVGTIVKMVLNGLPEGSVIQSGGVELGIEAGYYMKYDPVDEKMILSDGTDGISFSFGEDGITVGADRTATVWLRCMSGVSDQVDLEVYGETPGGANLYLNRHVNLRAKGKTLVFKEGGLTTFAVDLRSPDVPNPDEDQIDFKTFNDSHDGVEVWWPLPENDYLQGYDCFLRDEDGNRYDLMGTVTDGTVFRASVSSGLAPGAYTLYVRALAVDGKISQQDYVEKELEIGNPITLSISYVTAKNSSMGDDFDLALDYAYDQTYLDKFSGFYFYLRYLGWHGGSPNHFDGYMSNNGGWAMWNYTSSTWSKVTVKTVSSYTLRDYQVYASDSGFIDGDPGTATPITGTSTGSYEKSYDLGNKKYFLILGTSEAGTRIHLEEISLEYYK